MSDPIKSSILLGSADASQTVAAQAMPLAPGPQVATAQVLSQSNANEQQTASGMPSTKLAIPQATDRVVMATGSLEDLITTLEKRLSPVLSSATPSTVAVNAVPFAQHDVPLAGTLHELADRLGAVVDNARRLLGRVAV